MWAAVRHESTRKGRQVGSADAWIAATALALSVPLVTNNPKDYRHLDRLQLVSVAAHNHLPPVEIADRFSGFLPSGPAFTDLR